MCFDEIWGASQVTVYDLNCLTKAIGTTSDMPVPDFVSGNASSHMLQYGLYMSVPWSMSESLLGLGGVSTRLGVYIYLLLCLLLLRFNRLILFFFHCR